MLMQKLLLWLLAVSIEMDAHETFRRKWRPLKPGYEWRPGTGIIGTYEVRRIDEPTDYGALMHQYCDQRSDEFYGQTYFAPLDETEGTCGSPAGDLLDYETKTNCEDAGAAGEDFVWTPQYSNKAACEGAGRSSIDVPDDQVSYWWSGSACERIAYCSTIPLTRARHDEILPDARRRLHTNGNHYWIVVATCDEVWDANGNFCHPCYQCLGGDRGPHPNVGQNTPWSKHCRNLTRNINQCAAADFLDWFYDNGRPVQCRVKCPSSGLEICWAKNYMSCP